MSRNRHLLPATEPHPPSDITIKSTRELEKMRQAGRIVAAAVEALTMAAKPGVRGKDLDSLAEAEIRSRGGKPSFKGYRGFPASICLSFNHEVVHGIPGERTLKEGDIVKFDVGAIVGGYHGDGAVSVGVGTIGPAAQRLLDVTRASLEQGIRAARAGNRIGDISQAIQSYVEAHGYSVVKDYTGHGIGRALHEPPQVPNFGEAGKGELLRPGMTIAIEPMVNIGGAEVRLLGDDWTVASADGSLSAHFEHTIAILDGDAEILTKL